MYGKLFASMFTGTLHGQWQAIVTFQQMIILADQDGTIEMTPQAMSATTSIPLDIIEAGIAILEAPDPNSRTPDEGGRRIIRINPDRPWGWHITNHAKYRSIRTAEERREYHRQYWHKRKQELQPDSTTTQQNQPIAVSSKHMQKHNNKKIGASRHVFVKPSHEEVTAYCKERGNNVSPNRFLNHYESNGWKVGKNPMKDWKAAVRTWEQNDHQGGNRGSHQHTDNSAPARVQRAIDKRAEERKHRAKATDGSAH